MPDSGVAGLMEVATAPAAFSFQHFSFYRRSFPSPGTRPVRVRGRGVADVVLIVRIVMAFPQPFGSGNQLARRRVDRAGVVDLFRRRLL